MSVILYSLEDIIRYIHTKADSDLLGPPHLTNYILTIHKHHAKDTHTHAHTRAHTHIYAYIL